MNLTCITRIVVAALALAIFTHLTFAITNEQSGQQKQQTPELLKPSEVADLVAYISKKKKGKAPLTWKKDSFIGTQEFWYLSVIQADGEKITFAYYPNATDPSRSFLSVWWHKGNQDNTFSSSLKLDGTIDFGVDPTVKKKMLLDSTDPIGPEHLPYWQTETTKRLRAGLAYFAAPTIGKGLSVAATAIKAVLDAFGKLPPEVQQLAVGALVANKLTGGRDA